MINEDQSESLLTVKQKKIFLSHRPGKKKPKMLYVWRISNVDKSIRK